jgi:diaminopimelate decarboxylase
VPLVLSAAEAAAAARRCCHSPSLRLIGLNFYAGTQQASLRAIGRELPGAARLARRLAELGTPVEELNLGGGLPSPSLRRLSAGRLWRRWRDRERPSDSPLLLEASARRLGEIFRRAAARAGLEPLPALALEPGRALVGNAAVLVTRVAAREGRWLFLDASRNFLGESPLLFTRRLLALSEPDGRRRFAHLAGSTLDTRDVIDWHRRLPPLSPGDALAVADAGAYSISRARRYAGLAPAVYLLTAAGEVRPARRAEALGDLTGPMTLPAPPGPG